MSLYDATGEPLKPDEGSDEHAEVLGKLWGRLVKVLGATNALLVFERPASSGEGMTMGCMSTGGPAGLMGCAALAPDMVRQGLQRGGGD